MNKGIGDYVAVTLLSAIIGFNKFGFDWFGLKAILFTNLVVITYAVLIYSVEVIIEKLRK